MAITFTWSVTDMHKVTETGAVYKVEWSCSGVDADTKISHSRSGSYLHTESVNVPKVTETVKDDDGNDVTREVTSAYTKIVQATPDHTASGFTPYADLTEADVLAWCKADGEGARTEALITKSINTKIANNANSNGLPWAAE
jgi:hypothetical protein